MRGNSASGKSTVARRVQESFPKGMVAVVGQDLLRREVLKVGDGPDNPAISLIDTVARHALDAGFHVVVEGILHAPYYGVMLRALVADHAGTSAAFRWELSFDETVRRHATKPQAAEYGPDLMRRWWTDHDPLSGVHEVEFDAAVTADQAVARVRGAFDWPSRL
ncbi:kinase [Aestuariimicrobium soli]|uniref:kinase n=1 Tax=Aestuariimicrobium soli TaxID=2035834 RepID=UPI003EB84D55